MPALIKTKYIGTIVHLGYMPSLSDGTTMLILNIISKKTKNGNFIFECFI